MAKPDDMQRTPGRRGKKKTKKKIERNEAPIHGTSLQCPVDEKHTVYTLHTPWELATLKIYGRPVSCIHFYAASLFQFRFGLRVQ